MLAFALLATSCTQAPNAAVDADADAAVLQVAAAASLTDVLDDIKLAYAEEQPDVELQYNFASSGKLQQQLEQGAPADIFFSAGREQMTALIEQDLIDPDSQREPIRNTLVLVVPTEAAKASQLDDLKTAAVERIAVGDFASVPAGQYAEATLDHFGLLPDIQPKLVFGSTVRQVLAFVEAGNADAGLVYATDAKISDQVAIATTAPPDSHPPIIYPIAILHDSDQAALARDYIDFLSSPTAQALFEQRGFTPNSAP